MRLTFHGTLLAVILILLAMMAIGPARQLYNEQQAIHRDEVTLAAGTTEANQLVTRLQQLQDPSYVQFLARRDLGYVLPGETSYVVPVAGQGQQGAPQAPSPAPRPRVTLRSRLQQIWDGLTAA